MTLPFLTTLAAAVPLATSPAPAPLCLAAAVPGPVQTGGETPRILPLGDSITVGFGALGGYRLRLTQVLAGAADLVGSSVVNSTFMADPEHEGHGGWTFGQLVENPEAGTSIEGWLDAYDPDVLLVHGGTNDVQQLVQWQGGVGALRQLLSRADAHSPGLSFRVAQIIPTGTPALNLLVESFNRGVAQLVRDLEPLGLDLAAVDMYGAVGGQFQSGDGTNVHPNKPIYDAMADAWLASLAAPPAPPVEPAPALAVAGASASSPGASQFVDGSGLVEFPLLGPLAEAEAPGTAQAWVSQPFGTSSAAGEPVVVDPPGSVWIELDLGLPGDVEWLQLFDGRVLDPGIGPLVVADAIASLEVSTSVDRAAWTPRGTIDLRPIPAVPWSPGERFEVDWPGVRYVRLEVVALHEAVGVPGEFHNAALTGVLVGGVPVGLSLDAGQISLSQGGSATITLNAGDAFANAVHFVLGSLSGTAPATPVDGLLLPLALDAYTLHTVVGSPGGPVKGGVGLLDAEGRATAKFTLPPGTDPSFAGTIVHHAFLALPLGSPTFTYASSAAALRLVP